jgi:hypothetical protein
MKRKVKLDPKLGGQMEGEEEGSLLGGQWKEKKKVPCLVDNGKRRRRFLVW